MRVTLHSLGVLATAMCLATTAPARTPDLLLQDKCSAIPSHAWDAAQAGSAQAQFMLAHALMGDVCDRTVDNIADAVHWLGKASDQGHLGATLSLAVMYDDGDGIPANADKAIEFYRRAAEAQHADSQHHLGLMLTKMNDELLKQEGLYWLGSAATQGDDLSAAVLGVIYARGMNGVPQDYCLALDWFEAGLLMDSDIPLQGFIRKIPAHQINKCQD